MKAFQSLLPTITGQMSGTSALNTFENMFVVASWLKDFCLQLRIHIRRRCYRGGRVRTRDEANTREASHEHVFHSTSTNPEQSTSYKHQHKNACWQVKETSARMEKLRESKKGGLKQKLKSKHATCVRQYLPMCGGRRRRWTRTPTPLRKLFSLDPT